MTEPGLSNALCPRPPLLVKVGFIGAFVGEGLRTSEWYHLNCVGVFSSEKII